MKPRTDRPAADQSHVEGPIINLRILETTDLHGHAHGYDYFKDSPCSATGFSRIATLIETARNEARNILLFDNGDAFQGTPMAQFWGEQRGLKANEYHPMIEVFNLAGYDAATVGNHDFDYGIDFLKQVMTGARFPFVSANAHERSGDGTTALILPPWAVLERDFTDTDGKTHRLRIGVIGLLPPQTALWTQATTAGRLVCTPFVEAAQEHLPALLAQKPDLVIALAHTGIAPLTEAQRNAPDLEQAALALARIDGIDVLLCGHTHLPFPNNSDPAFPGIDPRKGALNGKPALNAGRWGSHLGVLDLQLARDPQKGWTIDGFACELRPIRQNCPTTGHVTVLPEASGMLEALESAHSETLRHMRRPVGRLTARVHSFFSQITVDPTLIFLAHAQRRFARQRLTGHPEEALPIISAVAPFKCGGRGGVGYYVDIPSGPIIMANVDDIYVYTNAITALEVTGADLADWLERSAGAFQRLSPEHPEHLLLDPAFPAYNFDVLDGLTYAFDLRGPRRYAPDGSLENRHASRVRHLCYNGTPVRPEQRFLLVTNSYRSSGANGFVRDSMRRVSLGPAMLTRDILIGLVDANPVFTPTTKPIWRFAPMPGCSAIFETSPKALNCLEEIAGFSPAPMGYSDEGFLRLRLDFGQHATAAPRQPRPWHEASTACSGLS